MADNVTIPASGTGTTTPVVATDDVSGVHYQKVKLDGGGDGATVPIVAGAQASSGSLPVVGPTDDFVTVSATVTRPADTTAYAAGDTFANSTSAPTAGGYTLSSVAKASGGSGIITDAVIAMSTNAGTSLVGEIWVFNQALTTVPNDNAAFSLTSADRLNLVGVIPFTTNKSMANGAICHVQNLMMGFTCVGSANLRFVVKVLNAYTPGNAEVLSVLVKVQRTT